MESKRINFRTDWETELFLKTKAAENNLTLSSYLNFLIENYRTYLTADERQEKKSLETIRDSIEVSREALKCDISVLDKKLDEFLSIERNRLIRNNNELTETIKHLKAEVKKKEDDIEKKNSIILFFKNIAKYIILNKSKYESFKKDYAKLNAGVHLERELKMMDEEILPILPDSKGLFG